uniref:Uncharacterized protein n=1 Tax=Picea glauca TaxID=3330 RepID=A0A117NFI3_PICGL|nr:hypothetical protein ABT39_MTgene3503 [Picea glauca]
MRRKNAADWRRRGKIEVSLALKPLYELIRRWIAGRSSMRHRITMFPLGRADLARQIEHVFSSRISVLNPALFS